MSITKTLLYTAVLASMAANIADAAIVVSANPTCTCACMYPGTGTAGNTALPAYALAPTPDALAEFEKNGNDAALAYGDVSVPNVKGATCKTVNGTACHGWSHVGLQNGTFAGCM